MSVFPTIDDAAAFGSLLFRSELWVEAIDAIAARHHLTEPFSQSVKGSTVVFLSERWCIKLHPPFPGFLRSHRRELAALACVAGKLPIATPELVADGELDGWRYFVTTRLPGVPIDVVWDGSDGEERVGLARQVGEAVRELHRLRGDSVRQVTDDWRVFVPAQRARCLELEASKGLSAARQSEVARFLEQTDRIPESPRRGLLHTEIGPGHVLVDRGRIAGLIDFGDARVGDPEYDLAPVGMFVTRGDPAAFRAFGLAYGLAEDALADPDRPVRLLRHALLHQYGTLAWYLDVLRPPLRCLADLATHWFAVA